MGVTLLNPSPTYTYGELLYNFNEVSLYKHYRNLLRNVKQQFDTKGTQIKRKGGLSESLKARAYQFINSQAGNSQAS